MERDTFIITLYCCIADLYQELTQHQPLRRGGFMPQLTDPEVITIEMAGEIWKLQSDKDIFQHFHQYYPHFFPQLRDRTLFCRQAANLALFKERLWHTLVNRAGQHTTLFQSIDTFPVPICRLARATRDRCLRPFADYGYCAAKDEHYYGFKGGLRISPCGMIVGCGLFNARHHDVNYTEDLVEGYRGTVLADKGFLNQRQLSYLQQQGIQLLTPVRANMKPPAYHNAVPLLMRLRRIVETVGSQLNERFAIDRIRVRDFWHFQQRFMRKILAHTWMVFLNLSLHRDPLDFDGILST